MVKIKMIFISQMYNYPHAMSEEEILGNIKIPIGKAVAVDKPARLIIRLLFGFASDIWQTQPIYK